MTWAELIRRLRAAGCVEQRLGKGSHRKLVHSTTKKEIWEMTTRYPIVFEAEATGAVSAYVPDLPVYAAADTAEEAEREVRDLLARYLADRQARGLPLPGSRTVVKVARVSSSGHRSTVTIVGPAALLGRQRSAKKAAAARRNGLRCGRPRGAVSGR